MKTLAALFLLVGAFLPTGAPGAVQDNQGIPNPVSSESYLTIHNVRPAHEITLGAGSRVGILDHSFGGEAHPELYSGVHEFRVGAGEMELEGETHRGYWMALALREIAPSAEIYALDIGGQDKDGRIEAIAGALEWAITNQLDVVSYCSQSLSPEDRERLDPIVDRAIGAGVVVVLVDYPHPLAIVPGGFGPPPTEGPENPDLNIFSYDCTALLAREFVTQVELDDDGIQRYRPFLTRSSAASVTAGFVALMRSVDGDVSPQEVKEILMATSKPTEVRGLRGKRTPDAFLALSRLKPGKRESYASTLARG